MTEADAAKQQTTTSNRIDIIRDLGQHIGEQMRESLCRAAQLLDSPHERALLSLEAGHYFTMLLGASVKTLDAEGAKEVIEATMRPSGLDDARKIGLLVQYCRVVEANSYMRLLREALLLFERIEGRKANLPRLARITKEQAR